MYLDFQILIGDEIDYKYIPRSVAAARNASIERLLSQNPPPPPTMGCSSTQKNNITEHRTQQSYAINTPSYYIYLLLLFKKLKNSKQW